MPTSTFRPTWTPTVQPTFTPYPFTEDSRPRFLLADFILPQPGCDLPCWNGLEAGQRLPEDLSPLLHALGINRDRIAPFNEAHYSWIRAPFSSYPYSILDPEDGGIWLVENGDRLATITLLATNLRNPPSTELHYVAQAIGIPDFIALTYTGPYGDYLLLDYVGLGIAIGLHHSLVPETPDAYPRLICMGRARAEADITFYTVLTHCDATHGYGQGCIPFGSEHTPTPLPALLGLSVENTFIKLQDPTQCFKMP